MSLDEGFSDVIRRVYAAGEDARAWDRLGVDIIGQLGARVALMTTVDLARESLVATRFFGPEDTAFARGIEEYPALASSDPTLRWAALHPEAGFCASDDCVEGDYRAHPFIRWNEARFGASHWYVCYSAPTDGLSHSLSIHVPAAEGQATAAKLHKFRMLFEHVDNAARLQLRPPSLDEESAAVALDRNGLVAACNTAGEKTLARGDGLSRSERRLVARDPREAERLDRLIARALDSERSGAGAASMLVARGGDAAPWLVTVRPTYTRYGGVGPTQTGIQVRWREFRPPRLDGERLRLLLDLSAREGDVLALLVSGHSLETAAARLGITRNTVRVHLQAIFAKTRTTRQAELLQLCARLDAALDD